MAKKFDWKITGMKFVKVGLVVIISGVLSVYADNPYILALAPALTALSNWLKHSQGIDLKII